MSGTQTDPNKSITLKQNKTVKFNVGGRLFEVSRSLLDSYPDSMISRSAAEVWNEQKSDEPIFIERDGERFGYVLDYMRDGSVELPPSISKEALVKDMNYCGFDNIELEAIRVNIPVPEIITQVDYVRQNHKRKIELLEDEKKCEELAFKVFECCMNRDSLSFSFSSIEEYELYEKYLGDADQNTDVEGSRDGKC